MREPQDRPIGRGRKADKLVGTATGTAGDASQLSAALLNVSEDAALTAERVKMGGKIALQSVLLIHKSRDTGKKSRSSGTASAAHEVAS